METRIHLHNHYSFLIYPFIHSLSIRGLAKSSGALGGRWRPWWTRLSAEETATALDDTHFFLPYVRSVVYPVTRCLEGQPPGDRDCKHAQLIQRWAKGGVAEVCRRLPDAALLRLTLAPEQLEELALFSVTPYQASESDVISGTINWVDCLLFPSGIGFIVLKVRLAEPKADQHPLTDQSPVPAAAPGAREGQEADLGRLIDLNEYLRLVHPPTLSWNLPRLQFGDDGPAVTVRDLMDYLTQGLVTSGVRPCDDLAQFARSVAAGDCLRYSDTEQAQVYGERCQLLSYACVDAAKDCTDLPAGVFDSVEERMLFEFATCVGLGATIDKPEWVPSAEQVEELQRHNRFRPWECWRGMALKETVVFLATESLGFTREKLAHNIESDYLPLYMYTLYQNMQLYVFSNDLMREGADVAQRLHQVQSLMDRFVDFRNRYWFSEVTRKPLGGELYRKFQQGQGVPALYDLVCGEVQDLEKHYEERAARRMTALLNWLTFAFMPLGAVLGIFGMTFLESSWPAFLSSCVAAGGLSYAAWRRWGRG